MIFPQNTLSFYEMILFVSLSKEVVHLFTACTWYFLLRRFLLWRLEFGRYLVEQFLLLYFQTIHTDWLKIVPAKSSFMTSWIWDFVPLQPEVGFYMILPPKSSFTTFNTFSQYLSTLFLFYLWFSQKVVSN